MADTAYVKLCVRVADLAEPVVPSVKRRCLLCGNWVWDDPIANIPELGTALHVCEHCIPELIERHLSEGDEARCP